MISKIDLLEAKRALRSRVWKGETMERMAATGFSLAVSSARAALRQNVHALGIGRKIVKGKATRTRCIRLYVAQKYALAFLPSSDRLPREVDGIPTDIIESAPAFILRARRTKPRRAKSAALSLPPCTSARKDKVRPLLAGISTAHFKVTAGTLTYFCRSIRPGDDPGQVLVLSNNHVYADVNRAHPGDELRQPGPADGGVDSSFRMATLLRWVPIRLGGIQANTVDAAIGQLSPGVAYTLEVCSIGRILGVAKAAEDMAVCKHGRTTGYTEGVVDDESYDALIGMDHDDSSLTALFENQMRLKRSDPYPSFGLGGDSGSLIVQKAGRKAVGLYFAGPSRGDYGVANPIDEVLTELQVALL
jgi:hypothetical protein